MDVNLGPWMANKSVDAKTAQPLIEAMKDEAWKTVQKSIDFNPAKGVGTRADKGFTISGILTKVARSAGTVDVAARFEIYVDGQLSTMPISEGRASASGGMGADDAIRAITETRVKASLAAIKAGRVKAMGRTA